MSVYNYNEFDLFDFAVSQARRSGRVPTHQDYAQSALGFLCSLAPDAVGVRVPARIRKYQVTAAGFWRGSHGKSIDKTAVVMLYERFDNCFADCADRDARLAVIHSLLEQKERLESVIRVQEPHLASSDDLFDDFRSWDYASSTNAEYRKLCRKLDSLRMALHQGSRLENIRRTGVADYCYLAVPEGLVEPGEIAMGWGLVYLKSDRSFTLVREADPQDGVTPAARQILAQNIAVAAADMVTFASGVDRSARGRITYRRLPRRRSKF
ncbi:MAG: hypothetical protein PHI35_03200 [Victivallaceae bacterium]|nr:hypothetical protein [Victivallaceae bacterium]